MAARLVLPLSFTNTIDTTAAPLIIPTSLFLPFPSCVVPLLCAVALHRCSAPLLSYAGKDEEQFLLDSGIANGTDPDAAAKYATHMKLLRALTLAQHPLVFRDGQLLGSERTCFENSQTTKTAPLLTPSNSCDCPMRSVLRLLPLIKVWVRAVPDGADARECVDRDQALPRRPRP